MGFFKTVLTFILKCLIFDSIFLLYLINSVIRAFTTIASNIFRPDLLQIVDKHFTHLACQVYSEANVAILVSGKFRGELNKQNVANNVKRILEKPEYHRLKECIVPWWGHLFWKLDKNFNIKEHILKCKLDPTSPTALKKLQQSVLSKPFPTGKSPWFIYIVTNSTKQENEDIFMLKIHHSLADGHSILKLLINEIFDEPSTSVLKPVAARLPKLVEIWLGFTFVLKAINWLSNKIISGEDPALTPSGGLASPMKTLGSGGRKYYSVESREISVDSIKLARRRLNVPFMGIILSALSQVLRNVAIRKVSRMKIPSHVTCVSPFPIKNHPGGLENHWSVRLFPLPIGEQDELKVVKDVRANLTKNVVSNVMMMRALTGVVGTMPYSWVQKSGFTDIIGIPLVVSEFPGPTKQISGFGLPLVEISFQVGFHKGNCGLMFFGTSYKGMWRMKLNADIDVISTEEEAQSIVNGVVNNIISYSKAQ